MKRIVRPSEQVVAFAWRLAPEPRRAFKQALEGLREEKGEIRSLEAGLVGYYRLRVGRHRLIFAYAEDGAIAVVFAEERSVVYEVFASELMRRIKGSS